MLTVLNETQQVFDGVKYYLCATGYYRGPNNGKSILMHRAIWEFYNGPIPEGYVVHHIDGDKANNVLENLELLPIAEHHSIHSRSAEHLEKFSKHNTLGTKASWVKASAVVHVCKECGVEFHSHSFSSKYCSKRCRNRAYREIYPRKRKRVA